MSNNTEKVQLLDIEGNTIEEHDIIILPKPAAFGFMLGVVTGWNYSEGVLDVAVVVDGFAKTYKPHAREVLVRQPLREAPDSSNYDFFGHKIKISENSISKEVSPEEKGEIRNIDLQPLPLGLIGLVGICL